MINGVKSASGGDSPDNGERAQSGWCLRQIKSARFAMPSQFIFYFRKLIGQNS